MSTLVLEVEPTAVEVTVTDDDLTVRLADGRIIIVPLATTKHQNSYLIPCGWAANEPNHINYYASF